MENSILLKSVRIADPNSASHGKTLDVLVENGLITAMKKSIEAPSGTVVWSATGAVVSPGWMDMQADFKDPGEEQKEGLSNGTLAALHGGMAHVVLNTGQTPAPDSKAAITYLQNQTANSICLVHPLACLSKERNGKQLAELYDLAEAGAVGYSDDGAVEKTELLRRGLEYAADAKGPVIVLPIDTGLNARSMMHEGAISTQMGVQGNPSESELMRIQRDLEVLRYAGGKLHFSVISTAKGVNMIRAAKQEGLAVTCATSAHHLYFEDRDLQYFDGTLRTCPPFRASTDRRELLNGILDGTIDALVSDHRPEDLESHDVEFALAPNGLTGVESTFAVALAALSEMASAEEAEAAVIRALTLGPRSVFGWETPKLEVGTIADLTWFQPNAPWTCSSVSLGANVPSYSNAQEKPALTGNPCGVITRRGAFKRT